MCLGLRGDDHQHLEKILGLTRERYRGITVCCNDFWVHVTIISSCNDFSVPVMILMLSRVFCATSRCGIYPSRNVSCRERSSEAAYYSMGTAWADASAAKKTSSHWPATGRSAQRSAYTACLPCAGRGSGISGFGSLVEPPFRYVRILSYRKWYVLAILLRL